MVSTWNRRTAWLIALLAVLCAAFVSRVTALSYVRNEAEVRRTLALRAAIGDTLSLLKDAETGQRGFLLTGDPAFLPPHAHAEGELPTPKCTKRSGCAIGRGSGSNRTLPGWRRPTRPPDRVAASGGKIGARTRVFAHRAPILRASLTRSTEHVDDWIIQLHAFGRASTLRPST